MKKRKSALSLLSVTAALLAGGCPETPPRLEGIRKIPEATAAVR